MGKQYILDNIEVLRKQRDDRIKDGYRAKVVRTYVYLRKGIELSNTNFCNPKYSDISKHVFGNRNQERTIRGYIKDLQKSGYITVYGIGEEKEIKIVKELDF